MGVWDTYETRLAVSGETKRDAMYNREVGALANKMKESLSYTTVTINETVKNVAIIDSDKFTEKTMISLPGDSFVCGDIVNWGGYKWLITEKDFNHNIQCKAKLLRCNYLLKWVSNEGVICQQWCSISDGATGTSGESESAGFVLSEGNARISITMGKNSETSKLNRTNRFIIDDEDSEIKLVFELSKPLKVGRVFDEEGVFTFVVTEVASSDYDNMELGIADYYKYYPRAGVGITQPENNEPLNNVADDTSQERGSWL